MDISDELSSKLSYLSYSTGRDGKERFLLRTQCLVRGI